jgi:hypothetical protein
VTLSGANANFAALANLAAIDNRSTFSLTAGSKFTTAGNLSNSGGVDVVHSVLTITKNLSNTGTVNLSDGALTVTGTVAQLSGNFLTAGTWNVGVNSNLNFASGSNITSLDGATVTLSGTDSDFAALTNLATISSGSSFSLLGGRSFTTAGNFRNNGTLTVGPGSVLTTKGSFTQASTAALNVQLGGTNSAPTFGKVVSTSGTVTLGGTLHVTSAVVPAVGSSFEILANEGSSPISGAFAELAEGSSFTVTSGSTTMTFKISYKGGSGNDVTITRVS